MLLQTALEHTNFQGNAFVPIVIKIAEMLTISFMLMRLCTIEYGISSVIKIIVCILVLMISAFTSGTVRLLKSFILVICAKNIDLKDILKFDLKFKSVYTVILITLSLVGILPKESQLIFNNSVRYVFGFIHPNIFGTYITIIMMEYFYVYKVSLKKYLIIVLPILTLFTALNVSRTMSVCIAILIILVVLYYCRPKIYNWRIFKYFAVIIPLVTIAVCFIYDDKNNVMLKLNGLLSGRLELSKEYFDYFGISVLGQRLPLVTNGYRIVGFHPFELSLDMAYINLIMQFGVITFLLLCSAYYLGIKKYSQKGEDNKLIIFILIFLIFGVTEKHIFNIAVNFSLFGFTLLIYKDHKTGRLCL